MADEAMDPTDAVAVAVAGAPEAKKRKTNTKKAVDASVIPTEGVEPPKRKPPQPRPKQAKGTPGTILPNVDVVQPHDVGPTTTATSANVSSSQQQSVNVPSASIITQPQMPAPPIPKAKKADTAGTTIPKTAVNKGCAQTGSDDNTTTVLNLILRGQPFTTQGAVDALGGKIKKPAMQTILDTLSSDGRVKVKEFKKTVVYYPPWVPQQETPTTSTTEGPSGDIAISVEDLQDTLRKLQVELRALETEHKSIQADLLKIQTMPTLSTVKGTINTMEQEVIRLQTLTSQLTDGSREVITETMYTQTSQQYMAMRKLWVSRKSSVMDAVVRVASDMRNPAELMDSLGMETDEEA
eukprot:PhF_6_TR8654/c0_g1_i2/m.13524/K06695/PSMC3IP; 26S proteasome regulatory subunit, ATPase 3, interacting protein